MSETATLNKKKVQFDQCQAPNKGGEGSGGTAEGPSHNSNNFGNQGAAPVIGENSKPPSINAAATSLNEESERPASVKGKQFDERIEDLVALFRDFLETTPNPATSNLTHTQQTTAGRKRFLGLNKGLSSETGPNNRYDYEQKYPRDRLGEEVTDNARVWLTYLDEAESFDRERVEGWKDTADVLLVFAGLFSGVITTFVSQASQSLQQDNTQVSASLLYEIAQLLRAHSSGIPINHVPNSTLTPTSPFIPSTNAFLVNGLWFTSLAITLSTALFAVLAKQWLYYYLSSITGTAHEKARARHLRFKGFELWKVGAIVDLLPILLHLAVGIFLTGIVILLFPLDIHVAWTIVIITGITYFLYFISVILPIRYPECPYTTSLTIYAGVLVFFLQTILSRISATSRNIAHVVGRRISFEALRYTQYLLQHTCSVVQHAFSSIFNLASGVVRCGFDMLRDALFTEEFPEFSKWREENIKRAVKDVAFLDFEALYWLYGASPNRSVRRIIARCAAVHPIISQHFEEDILVNLWQTLEVNETNVVDLRYGLCLDLNHAYCLLRRGLCPDHLRFPHLYRHWNLLRSILDVKESRLEEAEYQSYFRITENVLDCNYEQIMKDAINDNHIKLPLAMWHFFFKEVSVDVAIAAHILTCGRGLVFEWKTDPTCESIRNASLVSLDSEELEWWKFEYLYRHFFGGTKPDYSLDKTFETRYRLFITIYRNLTSDEPLIADKERRHESMYSLFINIWIWLDSKPRVSPEQYLVFFRDICCVDAFWSKSMTDYARSTAVLCLDSIWESMDTDVANQFPFTECDDLFSIYQWCSRRLHPDFSRSTTPIFTLLLMPQNRDSLCTHLSRDPNAVSHLTNCFRNSRNCRSFLFAKKYVYKNLMDILKSVNPRMHLFDVLYHSPVPVQLWEFFVFHKYDMEGFLLVVKSKLDQEKLVGIYTAMMNVQAQSDEVTDSRARELGYDKGIDVPIALEVSVDMFRQIIGVSRSRLEPATEQSTPERVADKDHDIEERAQPEVPDANESKGFHSIANWTKKAFGSVWPKTSVK